MPCINTVHIHIHTYMCFMYNTSIYIHMYVCMYVCLYVCIYVFFPKASFAAERRLIGLRCLPAAVVLLEEVDVQFRVCLVGAFRLLHVRGLCCFCCLGSAPLGGRRLPGLWFKRQLTCWLTFGLGVMACVSQRDAAQLWCRKC